ncbi:serine/threonine-protein kinase [Streptomyces sp. NPDC058613]|uniref:serine/threonine-protein kinase n=1 Tax=Streptomyces sp. NPDC058613 TaxID=3346556 RepID=UPI00365FB899
METSEAGRQLIDGRFELIKPLGAGGMGTVWRARDIALHRDVALKEVRPPDPATAAAQPGLAGQLRERAVREARALARLAHQNVVTIHHIVEPAPGADGHPWIVMEMVRGGSLYDRLESGPMPVPEVIRLGLDVLSALRAAHAEGVLHRDVKPANVLLRPDGSAVLTDFGIAALHDSAGLTSTGVLIGSPEYIAPERVRGAEGLAASDLWSLGMMLYVAGEGVHPLRRASSLATVVAVLDEPLPAPVRSGPLGPVLERLLVRDPAARPDAALLEQLLRGASTALAGPAAGYGPPPPPVRPAAPAAASQAPTGPPAPYGPYRPSAPLVHTPSAFRPGGGSPYDATAPLPAARGPRRRTALIAAVLTVALTGGVVGLVQWLPFGGERSGGDAKGATTATTATTATSGPGTPAAKTPVPQASTPQAAGGGGRQDGSAVPAKGGLLTPAGIRTALEALKQQTGTTVFVDLLVYDGYVLASIPTAPGARTVDAWQYRDGAAKRTGPKGTVDADKPLIDMSTVSWDALPGLLEQSRKELGVSAPTSRYVIVDAWMMDGLPCMRPYLSDEYGQGGYVLAGIDGKVRKVQRS